MIARTPEHAPAIDPTVHTVHPEVCRGDGPWRPGEQCGAVCGNSHQDYVTTGKLKCDRAPQLLYIYVFQKPPARALAAVSGLME